MKPRRHFDRTARLATLGIAGQGLFYLLSVLLARRLGVDGFEAYSVAVAAVTLLASFATRGLEKYALRLLPALFERGDWPRARGYLRFGLRRILGTSLVAALLLGLGWTWRAGYSEAAVQLAVAVGCLALPAVALVDYGVEVLSANGHEVRATAIYRVAIPAVALSLVGLALLLPFEVGGATAVACWGLAWILGLAAMAVEIRRTAPPRVWSVAPQQEARAWQRKALPFVAYGLSLTFIAQAGVIALDRLQPSPAPVGAYAAAMGTANLVIVLATATNRFYAPQLSLLLERGDFASMLRLRRERLAWVIPAVGIFLAVVFAFGRQVLALFRPEFVEEGLAALRVLAPAAAFTILFSMAPTYLKYAQRNRLVIGATAGAAGAQVVLLVLLVPRLEALGAAIAYAVCMCGLYGAFGWLAYRELLRLRAEQT